MSPDAPDQPASFARLQQQLILTEVELMKLEDLRDELTSRADASNRLVQNLQRLTDQACAERDHLAKRTGELDAALRQAQEQVAQAVARNKELTAVADGLQAVLAQHQARSQQLSASLLVVESSLTWRLTAPFRALGRVFRRRA